MNGPFKFVKHAHDDGEGLNSFQIHRLWQQFFMDYLTYGSSNSTKNFQNFTREQLIFIAGVAESYGMVCYDAGFKHAEKIAIDRKLEANK